MVEAAEPVIQATGIKKYFGDKIAVDIDEFEVRQGELLVILGPSGAGKSVFLRILNLLEPPTSGKVLFEGREVLGLAGDRRVSVARRMALIFQDPLLFRGTVGENIAYGLKVRKEPADARAAMVSEMLELVKLDGMKDTFVTTLSGGEAQRVALARALVISPRVLFLDEPFASLDVPTRKALQVEVKDILNRRGITAVFVTHDQEEAARLGDRILVFDQGKIAQAGNPRDIFYQPETEFVARFVGVDNIYRGRVIGWEDGLADVDVGGGVLQAVLAAPASRRVTLGVRPEDVTLVPSAEIDSPASSRNAFVGPVTAVEKRGPLVKVRLECPFPLDALITRRSAEELGIEAGSVIGARFKAVAVAVIEKAEPRVPDIKDDRKATG